MSNRAILKQEFLNTIGMGDATVSLLAGDASFRKYDRVIHQDQSYVLMDAPPEHEDCRPFAAMTYWLEEVGFTVPSIQEMDLEKGFMLLADLGDKTFTRHMLQVPSAEPLLYERAIDALVQLHAQPIRRSLPIPGQADYCIEDFDTAKITRDLGLFTQWYMPALGLPDLTAEFLDLWQPFLADLQADNVVMALRDYHADNLMVVGDEADPTVGLLDYQDAVVGHRAYDLVSLLLDARRDVPDALATRMVERYMAAAGIADQAEFWRLYHLWGAQRNIKIIGIFARLFVRDGKVNYPAMIPHVWGLLMRNLAHPALKPVDNWLVRHVPGHLRHHDLTAGNIL